MSKQIDDTIRLALYRAVDNSLGVYCQSWPGPDGSRIERNEWQDGWNAALTARCKKAVQIVTWFKELTPETQGILEEMLRYSDLDIHVGDEGISLYVLVSDTFAYACADAEDVSIDELPIVAAIWRKYGGTGINAWVSIKRGEDVLEGYRSDAYLAAKAEIEALKEGAA